MLWRSCCHGGGGRWPARPQGPYLTESGCLSTVAVGDGRDKTELENAEALDDLYPGGGALIGLVWAFTTPAVLGPQAYWWHSFTRAGRPV